VERYAKGLTAGEVDVILDKDEYFLLGDNRANSRDSRNYGAVKRANIAGKVLFGKK
jgi:signal peptidase I